MANNLNKILKSFKNDGTECCLEDCNYIQLELSGNNASAGNAITLINRECLDLVLSSNWYLSKSGYPIAYGPKLGRVKLHQLLCSQFIGTVPYGSVVDHINRNRLDNRLENLRICTQKENSYNTSKRGGKFKGVSKMKSGWCARISKDGSVHTIKGIPSEKEAAKIYDMMAEELFGQFAGKNY
jgi:hypothetical protein